MRKEDLILGRDVRVPTYGIGVLVNPPRNERGTERAGYAWVRTHADGISRFFSLDNIMPWPETPAAEFKTRFVPNASTYTCCGKPDDCVWGGPACGQSQARTVAEDTEQTARLFADARLGRQVRELVNTGRVDVRDIMALFPSLRRPR